MGPEGKPYTFLCGMETLSQQKQGNERTSALKLLLCKICFFLHFKIVLFLYPFLHSLVWKGQLTLKIKRKQSHWKFWKWLTMGEHNDFQIFTDNRLFLRERKRSSKTWLKIKRNVGLDLKWCSFKVIRRKILLYIEIYFL